MGSRSIFLLILRIATVTLLNEKINFIGLWYYLRVQIKIEKVAPSLRSFESQTSTQGSVLKKEKKKKKKPTTNK